MADLPHNELFSKFLRRPNLGFATERVKNKIIVIISVVSAGKLIPVSVWLTQNTIYRYLLFIPFSSET